MKTLLAESATLANHVYSTNIMQPSTFEEGLLLKRPPRLSSLDILWNDLAEELGAQEQRKCSCKVT